MGLCVGLSLAYKSFSDVGWWGTKVRWDVPFYRGTRAKTIHTSGQIIGQIIDPHLMM